MGHVRSSPVTHRLMHCKTQVRAVSPHNVAHSEWALRHNTAPLFSHERTLNVGSLYNSTSDASHKCQTINRDDLGLVLFSAPHWRDPFLSVSGLVRTDEQFISTTVHVRS